MSLKKYFPIKFEKKMDKEINGQNEGKRREIRNYRKKNHLHLTYPSE
jgi:hypothetical protein